MIKNTTKILFLLSVIFFFFLTFSQNAQAGCRCPGPDCDHCDNRNASGLEWERTGGCDSFNDWAGNAGRCDKGEGEDSSNSGGGGGGGCTPGGISCGACSASCGGGTQTCTDGCSSTTQDCNTQPCCNPNDWGAWNPVCASDNCDKVTQSRTNACGTTQSRNCTCVITYPSLSPAPVFEGDDGFSPAPTFLTPTPTPATSGYISWFKTKNGDVHTNRDIIVSLPSLLERFATFLVTANALSSFAGGSEYDARPDLASEKNWYWYSPPYGRITFPELEGFFDYYTHFRPAVKKVSVNEINNSWLNKEAGNGSGNPIIEIDPAGGGVFTGDDLSLSGNRQLVLYINGDLVIKNNILFKEDSGVIFVVKGNLNITSQPIEVDGFFLVDKNVNTTDKNVDTPLLIKGAVMTSLNGRIFGVSRKVSNVLVPSEYFIFEPKYLVKFSQILGRSSLMWKEVAP